MSDKNNINKTNVMDMIIVLDKEKLPEDIRKLLEDHLLKDKQTDKLIDNKLFAIQTGEVVGNIYTDKEKDKQTDKLIDNKLFAIQTGEVVGNIYTDKEKDKQTDKPIDNKLFAIQTGEVVGNIYTDKEKDVK